MAPLPKPQSKVTDLIYAAWEAAANDWDGLGFSPGSVASECDRELWLHLHWAAPGEKFDGRMLRLFDTGHREEERIVADLRMAGLEVLDVDPDTGKQFAVRALAGHFRGKTDGKVLGVPEAPAKWHVLEAKSHGLKSFDALVKAGAGNLREGKFDHWVQVQCYLHIQGIDRALYSATCKNDDRRWNDRVYYDHEFCTKLFARLERLIHTPRPPGPLNEARSAPACRFCKKKAVCKAESFARVNCRTCLHSTPIMIGDAAWDCGRHQKPLLADDQRAACANHLFIPDLVPGEQIDCDEVAETVTYRLPDGSTWIDGEQPSPAPLEVEGTPADG